MEVIKNGKTTTFIVGKPKKENKEVEKKSFFDKKEGVKDNGKY